MVLIMEKIYGESLKEIAQEILRVYGFMELPANVQIKKILECRCDLSNVILCAMREPELGEQLSVSLAKLLCNYSEASEAFIAAHKVVRSIEGMLIDVAPTIRDYMDKILFPEDFKCESEAA